MNFLNIMTREKEVFYTLSEYSEFPDAISTLIVEYVVPVEEQEERVYKALVHNMRCRIDLLLCLGKTLTPKERNLLIVIHQRDQYWISQIKNHGNRLNFITFPLLKEMINDMSGMISQVDCLYDDVCPAYPKKDHLKLDAKFPINYMD